MCVKIELTVGVQNQDFFFSECISDGAYLMVMPAETLATTKVNIAEIYAFACRSFMINMEN